MDGNCNIVYRSFSEYGIKIFTATLLLQLQCNIECRDDMILAFIQMQNTCTYQFQIKLENYKIYNLFWYITMILIY